MLRKLAQGGYRERIYALQTQPLKSSQQPLGRAAVSPPSLPTSLEATAVLGLNLAWKLSR